jgi:hypothetical protein
MVEVKVLVGEERQLTQCRDITKTQTPDSIFVVSWSACRGVVAALNALGQESQTPEGLNAGRKNYVANMGVPKISVPRADLSD